MKQAVVMGSLVLDISPSLRSQQVRDVTDIFAQGKVTELKDVAFYMGGCVGNTGLALHKLGIPTTLFGKVGQDFAGDAIAMLIDREGIPFRLQRLENVPTTVSVALTPPGLDKITLFLRGASQEYSSRDVAELPQGDLFHFGYPVTMHRLYEDQGAELIAMYRQVKEKGMVTSLDTALPRPESEPGKINWRPILQKLLPWVDIFVPSFEECLFMLDREGYCRRCKAQAGQDMMDSITPEEVRQTAQSFLDMGAKVVLLKLGSRGMYLRTAEETVLRQAGSFFTPLLESWSKRELWIFPNAVEHIVSTTGAGDVGIAGFLAALLREQTPEEALQAATTASWLCIQSSDTTSRLVPFGELNAISRMAQRPERIALPRDLWHFSEAEALFYGENDRKFFA